MRVKLVMPKNTRPDYIRAAQVKVSTLIKVITLDVLITTSVRNVAF